MNRITENVEKRQNFGTENTLRIAHKTKSSKKFQKNIEEWKAYSEVKRKKKQLFVCFSFLIEVSKMDC